MKCLLYLIAAITLSNNSLAQTGVQSRVLKKAITLTMALTADDDMPGTRGASVVWHPVLKRYYAAMAGNVGYPLCVFDAAGKKLSADDHVTNADVRGLWYNTVSKKIQGNAFGENGWFEYKLMKSGMVQEVEQLQEGQNQPDPQSVGAFYPAKKQVIFLKESEVVFYDAITAMATDSLVIHWGQAKLTDDVEEMQPEGYNTTNMVFTTLPGSELGFLNADEKQIELYSIKTGLLVKKLQLPETAVTETTFNFAYANGTFWLFDMDARIWTGYK